MGASRSLLARSVVGLWRGQVLAPHARWLGLDLRLSSPIRSSVWLGAARVMPGGPFCPPPRAAVGRISGEPPSRPQSPRHKGFPAFPDLSAGSTAADRRFD